MREITLLVNDREAEVLGDALMDAGALSVCIEGVETSEELLSVCELSPDYIQGYFFGQPCGFDTFMDTYIKNHSAGGA